MLLGRAEVTPSPPPPKHPNQTKPLKLRKTSPTTSKYIRHSMYLDITWCGKTSILSSAAAKTRGRDYNAVVRGTLPFFSISGDNDPAKPSKREACLAVITVCGTCPTQQLSFCHWEHLHCCSSECLLGQHCTIFWNEVVKLSKVTKGYNLAGCCRDSGGMTISSKNPIETVEKITRLRLKWLFANDVPQQFLKCISRLILLPFSGRTSDIMQELFFEPQRSISVSSKATTQLKVHTATEGTVFTPAGKGKGCLEQDWKWKRSKKWVRCYRGLRQKRA